MLSAHKSQKRVRTPRTGGIADCEPPSGSWELKLGSVKEQPGL